MKVLEERLKSFETMEEAKVYIERCKEKWYGPIGFIQNEETGKFDVYIFEYPETRDWGLPLREEIFFQLFFEIFPEEFATVYKV